MAENSRIEWTDHTLNFWWGCVKVSPGCEHCYAETFSKRVGRNIWGPAKTTERWRTKSPWRDVIKWNAKAQAEGVRRKVFCQSMSDFFEDHPQVAPWRADACISPDGFENNGPMTSSLGYSFEPDNMIDWVIVGGESGLHARPMHPDWARSIRDQCQAAGVPLHFKQWGEWLPDGQVANSQNAILYTPNPESIGGVGEYKKRFVSVGGGEGCWKVGKHAAGRLLDGREWNESPQTEVQNA